MLRSLNISAVELITKPVVPLLLVAYHSVTVCQAQTAAGPTESAGILGLSKDVLLWIIIGISSSLAITCVCIVVLVCILVCKKRAAKTSFTSASAVSSSIHGDAVRGMGLSRIVTETQESDSTVNGPKPTAKIGIGDKVTSDLQNTVELVPLDQR
ncbi:uncharacterized protein LOC110984879 [Acanthaster planci]|uniref:Uncharacterized protein LOC110984879 n=1 Tax=Acanthaster planci TaxID=133434 RepID=A0A8B7Z699_ACAPL|nr:uncharacterized protein LOC110984879 [Acanthaster planci]